MRGRTGAGHGVSPTLGNFIIENGVMRYVRKAVDGSGGRLRFITVVDRQGQHSWPDKYVKPTAKRSLRIKASSTRANAKYRSSGGSSTRAGVGSTKSKCLWTQSRPVPVLRSPDDKTAARRRHGGARGEARFLFDPKPRTTLTSTARSTPHKTKRDVQATFGPYRSDDRADQEEWTERQTT
jgi:hypothetical protein